MYEGYPFTVEKVKRQKVLEYLDPKRRWGVDFMISSLIVCTSYIVLLEWVNQGDWDGPYVWHAWRK